MSIDQWITDPHPDGVGEGGRGLSDDQRRRYSKDRAIFWTIQLIPQLVQSWRTKSTTAFHWGVASLPLRVYIIVQDSNVPLIVQPQLLGLFSLLSWGQCMYYGAGRSRAWCATVLCVTLALWGTLEAALGWCLLSASNTPSSVPHLSAERPQYYEIYKHGTVRGISLPFMAIDLLRGIFLILSLVFKRQVYALAAVAHALVVVMYGLVLVLALILNPRSKNGN
ncbi:hypothetical protein F5148DRAFT_1372130 [Russula earlei]|uniref:Uncharacterized protein n=1 Tax=Russula earlei TaxID=71964 RepID=A0ACC0TSR4_9AGAM|nr:hypothetical protein F5148DRAFT_1372130 [Russula earlei]